jgi:3-oxoacyl-[acyl-carrier protein] reductase
VYLCSPDARDISGRIVYASGGDLICYGEQLSTAGSRMIRKHGRWTQEELTAAVPPLLDIPLEP